MLRITINAQGLDVTDTTRRLVESDLGAILAPHGSRVASAHIRLWRGVGAVVQSQLAYPPPAPPASWWSRPPGLI